MVKRRTTTSAAPRWGVPLGVMLVWISRVTCFVGPPTRIRGKSAAFWKNKLMLPRPLTFCSVQTNVPNEAKLMSDRNDNEWAMATAKLLSLGNDMIHARRHAKKREDRLKPVRSLVAFLKDGCGENNTLPPSAEFCTALDKAIISGIRTAGSAGEFRLIFQLVESCLEFASVHGPMLPPRLFGEAIENLSSRTKANAGKIRQMWQLGITQKELLREPVGAFELNTMIKGLASRAKIRASLDLVRETDIVLDSYTASALFAVLADSIEEGQAVAVGNMTSLVSPCWQWNEAVSLMDNTFTSRQLNNYAYAAALKLNEKASEVFSSSGRRHYGATAAMNLLERMKRDGMSPDVVTCSLIMSAFDKGYQWNAAVTLLHAMVKHQTGTNRGSGAWSLPSPNVYSYASAISSCARCNEHEEALKLMNQMRNPECNVSPNTWVYNAALAACVQPASFQQIGPATGKPLKTALSLLQLMDKDSNQGLDTAPDTVSYNTVLAAMDGTGTVFCNDNGEIICEYTESDGPNTLSSERDMATELMDQMKERGIPRDAITYHNTIKALKYNREAVLGMLETAMEEIRGSSVARSKLKGRAVDGETFVCNAGLSVLAEQGEIVSMHKVLSLMKQSRVKANTESLTHFINVIGKCGQSRAVVTLIEALQGSELSRRLLVEEFGIEPGFVESLPFVAKENFEAAITTCLRENNVDTALEIVSNMKANGQHPSDGSMHEIAHAYCRLAMEAASNETRRELKMKKKKRKKNQNWQSRKQASRSNATSAYDMTKTMESPPARLLSAVSRALSAAGLWEEGRTVLRSLHKTVIKEQKAGSSRGDARHEGGTKAVLPGLHRSLLKLCARSGNVTAALAFVDDIQIITKWFPPLSDKSCVTQVNNQTATLSLYLETEEAAFNVSQEDARDSIFSSLNVTSTLSSGMSPGDIGMRAEDWKLLMIAASKSGHWKVCMGTLQFLCPFLEATNPMNSVGSDITNLDKQYGKISRSLTAAILCFEMRNQYAWAVRAIDDWITWSGRRPPVDGALAAFRILAAKGRGDQVNNLLSQILKVPGSTSEAQPGKVSLEETLYTGAITSLHANGLYDDADDIFLQGVSKGRVPFAVSSQGDELTLDLHGMNTALAHSAVRIVLQREIELASWTTAEPQEAREENAVRDLIIVTGRGINSGTRLRPVLRPEVQRMLQEEFYPPLSTASIPGNMGALRVPAHDVDVWLNHRRQEKGARILAVADAIRNLSSGNRLRQMMIAGMSSSLGSQNDTSKE